MVPDPQPAVSQEKPGPAGWPTCQECNIVHILITHPCEFSPPPHHRLDLSVTVHVGYLDQGIPLSVRHTTSFRRTFGLGRSGLRSMEANRVKSTLPYVSPTLNALCNSVLYLQLITQIERRRRCSLLAERMKG